jgi:hypothetical protein
MLGPCSPAAAAWVRSGSLRPLGRRRGNPPAVGLYRPQPHVLGPGAVARSSLVERSEFMRAGREHLQPSGVRTSSSCTCEGGARAPAPLAAAFCRRSGFVLPRGFARVRCVRIPCPPGGRRATRPPPIERSGDEHGDHRCWEHRGRAGAGFVHGGERVFFAARVPAGKHRGHLHESQDPLLTRVLTDSVADPVRRWAWRPAIWAALAGWKQGSVACGF